MTPKPPTRLVERALLRAGHSRVAGVDEVGRGSVAGPVSVGVVVVQLTTRTAPPGLRDSKLLTPDAREALREPIRRWCLDSAVGHASAQEIDAVGIVTALRVAARRALGVLRERGAWPEAVILDGSHDWLAARVRARAPEQGDLFGDDPAALGDVGPTPAVHLKVKADMTCAAVAAASVIAKCERDALMVAMDSDHPGYGWAVNKGYAVPDHLAALRELGPSRQHRLTWRLGAGSPPGGGARDALPEPGMMAP